VYWGAYDLTGDGAVTAADLSQIAGRIGSSSGSPNYDIFYDIAPAPNGDGSITAADLNLVAQQSGVSCRTSRFTYNGDGLRTARVSSRYSDMRYVWDVAAGLPVTLKEQDLHNALDGHGTDNTYVYGLDLISATDRAGAQTYYLYDGLDSAANLTDGSGNTTATYATMSSVPSAPSPTPVPPPMSGGSPGSSVILKASGTSTICAVLRCGDWQVLDARPTAR